MQLVTVATHGHLTISNNPHEKLLSPVATHGHSTSEARKVKQEKRTSPIRLTE